MSVVCVSPILEVCSYLLYMRCISDVSRVCIPYDSSVSRTWVVRATYGWDVSYTCLFILYVSCLCNYA